MAKGNGADGPIIIKKYANRRLYDTSTSSYVTLDHLSDLVRKGVDFEVRDAKSGDDLTRAVLTQIIFEQETKGAGALPTNFLRQLIRFYGDSMQSVLPAWLDMSMNSFAESQDKWRDSVTRSLTSATPMAIFESQARRNLEMFERAMRMFQAPQKPAASESAETAEPGGDDQSDALAALQAQLADMQAQLSALASKPEK
ncbi:MAG: polyhydroxyalkanoate synthesis repressor PhaR [Pseudomonadota bacterium]